MSVDRKKLLAELKKAKERMGKIRFLKKNTTTHLRIMEFEDEEGSNVFAKNFVEHKKANEPFTTRGKLCRSRTLGKPCAYCQVDKAAKEEGESSPYRFRNAYLVNAIDIDAPDKRVAIWSVPTTVHNAIAGALLDDQWADVLEPKTGHAFTIKKEGEGKETSYETNPMRSGWPVSSDLMKQVKDPLEVVDDPGLQAQLDDLGMNEADLFEGEDLTEFGGASEESQGTDEELAASEGPSEESSGEPEGQGLVEETGEEKPSGKRACFGDPDLFDEDSECKTDCEFFADCKEAIEKQTKKQTKKEMSPKCFGKASKFDESECKDDGCPWFDKCKKEIYSEPSSPPTGTTKGKRGRPRGSGKKNPEEKTSTKSKASKLLGK